MLQLKNITKNYLSGDSVILTMIAGLIPAKFEAKRDPVEALRTE